MSNPTPIENLKELSKTPLLENREILVGAAFMSVMVVYWRFVDDCRFAASDCHRIYYPLIRSFANGEAFAAWNHPMGLPLPTILQGGLMRLFGMGDFELAATVINAGLMIPCAWMTYLLAIDIGKTRTAGPVAVLLLLMNPVIVWRVLTTGNEFLYGTLLIGFCLSVIKCLKTASPKWLFAASLSCVLLSLTRGEGFSWTLLFLGLLVPHAVIKRHYKALPIALVMLAVLYVLLAGPRARYMKELTGCYILDTRQMIVAKYFKTIDSGKTASERLAFEDRMLGPKLEVARTTVHSRALPKYVSNTPAELERSFRIYVTVRGVVIGMAPLGLFFLFWLFFPPREWSAPLRWLPASKQEMVESNLALLLAAVIVVCQLGMMACVVFIEPRYMTMALPLLTAIVSGVLAKPFGKYRLPLLIAGLLLWSMVVLCKIPQWKYPIAVGGKLAELHNPEHEGTILSHSSIPVFYAAQKWCPIIDYKGRRYKMSEAEIIEMCREAQIEFIVPHGSPYWDPYVWRKEFSPEFAEKWEAATLRFKWDEGETLIEIVDAETLLRLVDDDSTVPIQPLD